MSDNSRAVAGIKVGAAKGVQFKQPQAGIRFAHVENVDRIGCCEPLRHLGRETPGRTVRIVRRGRSALGDVSAARGHLLTNDDVAPLSQDSPEGATTTGISASSW